MSSSGGNGHGFELPTTSISNLSSTVAAIGNVSSNSITSSSNSSSSNNNNNNNIGKKLLVPPSSAATTASTTVSATAAAAALLPGRRPRHQITRSISEFSPPLKMHRHRHSHHQHPTIHALHHTSSHVKGTAASGMLLVDERLPPPGRSSLDMTRSEHVTPNRSPDSSRRTSALVGPMVGMGEHPAAATTTPLGRVRTRKVDNVAALLVEKERTANRVTGLKKLLVELSGFSTTTTRRVDETYYSVLEKKTLLRSTISAIRELAVASQQMTGELERGAEELVREVDGQLGSLGRFEEQESRIVALQGRIETGRSRIQGLSERVDVVRRRIEGWERADQEWQEKTRKRLRTMWIVMSVVFAVLILLFVGVQYIGGPDMEAGVKTIERGLNRSVGGSIGIGKQKSGGGNGGEDVGVGDRGHKMSALWENRGRREDEDRLRVFDEL
ncbi:hypothetical protein CCHL11_01817 [Colletotrichum chlorophyti]|uniref:Uncharacterized protein n=1 Tax=Colletotrichum chlorophyti TaxID=708187 RepID=A0A1Q8RWB5_9PEZI|nr:hypothetical protein CCHL11_01817 [Colletotrichum chlorophyti]